MQIGFNPLGMWDERIAIILGFLTLLTVLAIYFSCRSFSLFMKRHGGEDIINNPAYQKFFKWHGTYWTMLFVLLLVHVVTAFIHVGIPEAGDPDSPIHWVVLIAGLVSALTVAAVYFSCRTAGWFLKFFTPKGPYEIYPSFFKKHSSIWMVFAVIIVIHIVFAFRHVGLWPPME